MAGLEDVYCTLVLSDAYLPGAAVLAHSLRDGGTTKKLACLILQDALRASTVEELQSLYNHVIPIDRIGNPQPANLYLMNRPDLLYTFTKIHLWRLTQFRKIVYVDADVVALRAPEELFDIEDSFAAAPDVGWPDCFNSGVMVISPHMGDYHALRAMASAGDSFDGGDQGLLNQYYEHRPWKRISFTYNTTPSANYQYEPAYRYYKRDIAMVHFIGREKPWQRGRSAQGTPSAFQEMLGRWWMVYDRHFSVSTDAYIAGQRNHVRQRSEPQHSISTSSTYSSAGYPAETTQPAPPPHQLPQTETHDTSRHDPHQSGPPQHASHQPGTATPLMTEPGEPAENIDQGYTEPTPTFEQRRFSAPHMEWDATRAAPPTTSKPEAANFPSQTYEFTTDPAPFRAPASYPEPPRDMWYDVPAPAPKEEKLKPLFPWEERQEARKPSRRFVEDEAPLPPPLEPELSFADELEVSDDRTSPITPTIKVNDDSPWVAFAQSRNAWDDDVKINDYVRALTAFQKNRGNVQVVAKDVPSSTSTTAQTHILSPSNTPAPEELIEKVRERRESLILTDFPSAMERPSLPVTPAPRRRPTFWGDERDSVGELPGADGVPDQADWDPSMQLDQLRRSSLLGPGDLKLPDRKLPKRMMPPTAEPLTSDSDYDGSNDERQSRKTVHISQAPVELIVPSGGSSPHGLPSSVSTSDSSQERDEKRTTNEYEFTAHNSSSTTTGRVNISSSMSETELNTAMNTFSVSGMPGAFEGSMASEPTGPATSSSSFFGEPNYQIPSDEVDKKKRDEDFLSPTSEVV